MSNINKVLYLLIDSSTHNLCDNNGKDEDTLTCELIRPFTNIHCSDCPLCNTYPSTKESIDVMRNKYNE